MNIFLTIEVPVLSIILAMGISLFLTGSTFAHCDTINGPVIPEARIALENGDVTPLLKWVSKEDEPEVKAVFAEAETVRVKCSEAKGIADKYFIETLVRLHRAGEGAPYTGIKDEPVEPIVAMADKALVDSSSATLIKNISAHMIQGIKKKFDKVIELQENKDRSVEAGRKYIRAYVEYMHYIEGIHSVVMSVGEHHRAANGNRSSNSREEHNED